MTTQKNKLDMDKAVRDAVKRVDEKEPQFQSNVIQASSKHKLTKQREDEKKVATKLK